MNILFITHTRIGDAVMSSGLLRHLVDKYPEAQVTIACGPLAAPLFAAVPRLARIIVVKKQRFDLHWFRLWAQIRGIHWDIMIDLRRSLMSYLVPVRERYVVGPIAPGVHHVAHLTRLLAMPHPAPPYIYVDAKHRTAAAHLIPDGPPVLAIAPVAATARKTWPPERFAALVARLLAGPCHGWRVAVLGGPGDEAESAPLLDALPHALRIFAEPDLLTVHAALARCGAFIGNDSGLAHLAASTGITTLALFGPTDPARYGPWGGAVVQAAGEDMANLTVDQAATAFSHVMA